MDDPVTRMESGLGELKREVDLLRRYARGLESRLERIENSLLFRSFRAVGARADAWKKRLGRLLLHSPFHPLFLRLTGRGANLAPYRQWISSRNAHTPPDSWFRTRASQWQYQPLVSIVMAVHNPRPEWLREAIDSVSGQTWGQWELCVCDDNSEAWVAGLLTLRAENDARIRFVRSDIPLGISAAQNRALELVTGHYVGFLDHDDYLAPFALHCVVEALQESRADLVYSDEDHVDEQGHPVRPIFKPAWSPELLSCCMYFGHLMVVERAALDRAGWFRSRCDGSQDYDLALRVSENAGRIIHIPEILYHWRQSPGSTAQSAAAKPYTQEAGLRALQDHLQRRSLEGVITAGPLPNTYRIRLQAVDRRPATVIICTRNARLLAKALKSIRRVTVYRPLEIIVVHHETGLPREDVSIESVVRSYDCKHTLYSGAFNFSEMNNRAARLASGSLLVFLNDDVRPLTPDWLDRIAARLAAPDVGVVGAKLIYPNGMIQHAGIATAIMDGAGHPGRRTFRNDYWIWLEFPREVSAVTGACFGVRADLFSSMSGFDPSFPVNYNDVDFCLRARLAGYRVIVDTDAVLEHDECATRSAGTSGAERESFQRRWAGLLSLPDPYYCRHLRRDSEEPALDFSASALNYPDKAGWPDD